MLQLLLIPKRKSSKYAAKLPSSPKQGNKPTEENLRDARNVKKGGSPAASFPLLRRHVLGVAAVSFRPLLKASQGYL
jgi:hypothetical protein